MKPSQTLVPIYTTKGDLGAFLLYPYIFDRSGTWIGWITPERDIYSIRGHYVGWLSSDPRILRKRAETYERPRQLPPDIPEDIIPPAMVPLAPMMPELPYGILDVLEDDPDLLPAKDLGELRPDMD
jgi:hypothetical protein